MVSQVIGGAEMKKVLQMICLMICLFTITFVAVGCSSESTYQLHNKDGSLNQDYIDDMNEYFEKHPEKLPGN